MESVLRFKAMLLRIGRLLLLEINNLRHPPAALIKMRYRPVVYHQASRELHSKRTIPSSKVDSSIRRKLGNRLYIRNVTFKKDRSTTPNYPSTSRLDWTFWTIKIRRCFRCCSIESPYLTLRSILFNRACSPNLISDHLQMEISRIPLDLNGIEHGIGGREACRKRDLSRYVYMKSRA
jgi:hypothetical protein